MSIQPTDIAIILVSLAACVYCFVLSRRLKALQDTKDGLGATIMALSKSISAVSSTTQDTRAKTGELAARLTQLLADADAMCTRLKSMKGEMDAHHASALDEVKAAHARLSAQHADLTESMRDLLEESKDRILDMKILMRQVQATSQAQSKPALQPANADLQPAAQLPETKSRYSYDY
ncbi:MAG: hypothetical protein MRY64_01180 [Hyphomonadaceae bacterium]|nr:hypothetical protein [Hyphomonadaceae bacterium]